MSRLFRRSWTRRAAWLLPVLLVAGCIVNVRRIDVDAHAPPFRAGTNVSTSVKAHVLDGSTIVYSRGVVVTDSTLEGSGERFDLMLRPMATVTRFPLDSVAAFESYREGTNMTSSVLATLGGTALGFFAVAALSVAIFGSCPTIYVDSAGSAVLQGEAFSYSIAPLFESRDVDRVAARPDAQGVVWLELRNEALETHYINAMELMHVVHEPHQTLLPDEQGRAVLVADLRQLASARDAQGRDVAAELGTRDDKVFASVQRSAEAVRAANYNDHIELTFAVDQPRDSAALVLRLRNSLFNTILFYDVMLGAAGVRSVDWIGGTLEDIGHATEMGKWYSGRSGVRVSVWRDGAWRHAGRVPDVGPIADKDVAVMLQLDGQREVRVRLEFLTDSWRIDYAGLALDAERAAPVFVPVHDVSGLQGGSDPGAVQRLNEPDDSYLATYPGHALRIAFQTNPARSGKVNGFLLAMQGYYIEWVRGEWARNPTTDTTFRPGDDALDSAYARWHDVKDDFEKRFFESRIPVRAP